MQSYSDTATSKTAQDEIKTVDQIMTTSRLAPEEEAALLADSNNIKSDANSLFANAAYSEAIQSYDRALGSCPNYLDYEVAVLKSNVAACHLKLKDWKEAIDAATAALESLERLDPVPKQDPAHADRKPSPAWEGQSHEGNAKPEIVEEVDDETAARIDALVRSGRTRDEVQKIRIKVLLRRAKAREEIGGWSSLQGADEDYRQVLSMHEVSTMDMAAVQKSLRQLAPKLERVKEAEMGQMIGKLKDLGNGLLKPFGLSTENFQFTKDETSGGYSMQFEQGKAGSK